VWADALCRWARAAGGEGDVLLGIVSGNQAAQHATERELAKEGLDRATLGPEAFAERARQHQDAARDQLAQMLAALEIEVDLDRCATDDERVIRAARTASVLLIEEGSTVINLGGLLTGSRCPTVIDTVGV